MGPNGLLRINPCLPAGRQDKTKGLISTSMVHYNIPKERRIKRKDNNKMIRRNLEHPEVKATRYQAHGGGVAHMILDTRHLQTLMFLAHAFISPGKKLIG